AGERSTRRVRGGRLVPAAAPEGPPLADDAPPRHDAARVGNDALGPGPLRRRHARDPRVLVRQPADPRRVPDRRGRETGRHRGPLVHGRRGGAGAGRATVIPSRVDSPPQAATAQWTATTARQQPSRSVNHWAGGARDEPLTSSEAS